jgi:hypothetical protein
MFLGRFDEAYDARRLSRLQCITSVAALPSKKRPIGLAGKEYPGFQISDAFFEPLPGDIVAAFDGEDL